MLCWDWFFFSWNKTCWNNWKRRYACQNHFDFQTLHRRMKLVYRTLNNSIKYVGILGKCIKVGIIGILNYLIISVS